ncbi:hypothetical protein EEL04_22310 [Escherichia coli]|nr:hypothetical protein [Escherichia coli]
MLSCLPGAPSAPGCLAASGRQARLRQAAAGAPASLRRTRWRGFGLSLRSDGKRKLTAVCSHQTKIE